jgi:hypothetical protein
VNCSLIDEYVKKPSAHGMSTFNGSSVKCFKPFPIIKWICLFENHDYSCSYGLLKGLKVSNFSCFFKDL